MRKFLIITLFCFNAAYFPAYAQYIPFDNYLVSNGLPSNFIADIEQDHQGYLWLATQAGAVKFDGYNFDVYTIAQGLPDNNIYDIFIDSKDRIWLATESGGLAVIDRNRMHVYNETNGLVSDHVDKILEDRTGNIWCFTFDGISIINSDTILNYNGQNSDVEGKIYSTYLALDGKVWFSTISYVFYYDGKIHKLSSSLFKGITVHDITENKPGSFWFATEGRGVIHISETDSTVFSTEKGVRSNISVSTVPVNSDTVIVTSSYPAGLYEVVGNKIVKEWISGLPNDAIMQILIDHRKRTWIRTIENGIYLLEKNTLTQITEENNLASNHIMKLFEDKNGNIWIATINGLSKYGKVIFHIYTEGFVNDDINVLSMAQLGDRIYFGTYSGLNVLYNKSLIKLFDRNKAYSNNPDVFSILPENENKIWLGTFDGLTIYKNNEFHFIPYSQIFLSEEMEFTTDIINLHGTLYCATSKGLVLYKSGGFVHYTVDDGLSDNNIWSLAVDTLNNIWCATQKGLSIFDGEKFHNYGTDEGLPHDYCNDITFDKGGIAWVATEKGISRIVLAHDWKILCKNFGTKEGLKSDIINSILADNQNFIWMGHNEGTDRLDPEDFSITHYGPDEGFLPGDNNLGAIIQTSDNDIWFGTGKGAVKYIPANDHLYDDPPKIYITGIELYNDSTPVENYAEKLDSVTRLPVKLKLPYYKNNLVFKYVGLHYTIIKKNQYKYILSDYNSDWEGPTHEITTTPYRKIPPGKYTFKVLAANCDGTWTKNPATFSFEIKPPFWQTWWCYTLEIIAAILVLILIVRLRERKLRHDKQQLTQKVKERTLEIEKQRDQIALQKKEITDSIEYAEKIQTAALPKPEFIEKFFAEYFILYKPRNIVSGDFYWINNMDKKLIVVAADCTGHGVPGAFMSMLGISILNEIASQKKLTSAGKILDTLRDHLTRTLRQTGQEEEAKDGMDLALCIIDPDNKTLQFAGAYNPLVLIRGDETLVYKGDKMPVGFHFGEMPPFTTITFETKKSDCIYMFSDGYADQFGGPEGKKFKSQTLRELLFKISKLPMQEQKVRLNETIEDWMGINEQVDDILLIGIRL